MPGDGRGLSRAMLFATRRAAPPLLLYIDVPYGVGGNFCGKTLRASLEDRNGADFLVPLLAPTITRRFHQTSEVHRTPPGAGFFVP
jgi:hypothetical protein